MERVREREGERERERERERVREREGEREREREVGRRNEIRLSEAIKVELRESEEKLRWEEM
jgi:hypothetical protein